MTKEELLRYVSPCSLLCYTCMAFKDGPIAECAGKLYNYNQGVCEFRGQYMSGEDLEKWNSFFNEFHETLKNFSCASCQGCRNNPTPYGGCIQGCFVPDCVKEHGVDFCAECAEFPCEKAKEFFSSRGINWESRNQRLKEIGAEAYFEENKDVSHYIHYKK